MTACHNQQPFSKKKSCPKMSVLEATQQQEKFIQDLLGFARKNELFLKGGRLLVAVSGGLDSTVLLHSLSRVSRLLDFEIEVAHVDHKTRGTASAQEGVWVQVLCERLQIPCHTLTVGEIEKSSQDAFRKARRALLIELSEKIGARWIASAHHADDNAETFLIRAISGAGSLGLSGISPTDGLWVRPLLWATKQDLENYARVHGLGWVEDPSNARDAYLRNRLRQEVIPTLGELRHGALRNLAKAAERLDFEERSWETWIEAQFDGAKENLSLGWLEKWPEPLKRRILRSWVRRLGVEPVPALVEALVRGDELIHGKGSFLRRSDTLIFSPHENFGESWTKMMPIELGKRVSMGTSMAWSFLPSASAKAQLVDHSFYLVAREPKKDKLGQFAWEKMPWPLAIRARQKSDPKDIDSFLEKAGIPKPFWKAWPLLVSLKNPELVLSVLGLHIYPDYSLKDLGRCVCLESFFEERLGSVSESC